MPVEECASDLYTVARLRLYRSLSESKSEEGAMSLFTDPNPSDLTMIRMNLR